MMNSTERRNERVLRTSSSSLCIFVFFFFHFSVTLYAGSSPSSCAFQNSKDSFFFFFLMRSIEPIPELPPPKSNFTFKLLYFVHRWESKQSLFAISVPQEMDMNILYIYLRKKKKRIETTLREQINQTLWTLRSVYEKRCTNI